MSEKRGRFPMKHPHHWIGSVVPLLLVLATGVGLAAWKYVAIQEGQAASVMQPAPMETVTVAKEIEHRQTTTSIGTVLALRSITPRNELAGTGRDVRLTSGQIVEAGTVLVALGVSVEEAELKAQEAQAALAKIAGEHQSDAVQHDQETLVAEGRVVHGGRQNLSPQVA